MDLLEMICKELGVEIGEAWESNDRYEYKINEYGEIWEWDKLHDEWIQSRFTLRDVVIGELKPRWIPVEGEVYYAPNPTHSGGDRENRYAAKFWNEDPYDEWAIENNMVYKTKEEAIAVANKMLEVVKNV